MEPAAEFAQLPLGFVDQTQWRYEVIRPLVLFADRTASQRAKDELIRRLYREAKRHGMRDRATLVNHLVESRLKDMEDELLSEVRDRRSHMGESSPPKFALGDAWRHRARSEPSPTQGKIRWS